MTTPMTIEMENEMTKDEIEAALNKLEEPLWLNGGRSVPLIIRELLGVKHYETIRAALQSAQVKAETVDIPEGFRMSPEQNIVWEWADAHGLTLVVDECNDLLWRLEKTK